MNDDERHVRKPAVDRVRDRLRHYTIVIVSGLVVLRVAVPPIAALFGIRIEDNGAVLLTLCGTLIVLLGLELPGWFGGSK